MSSVFEMNKHICPICNEAHAKTNRCSYDTLVRSIHGMREHIQQLMKANGVIPSVLAANKEAVETARSFQQIIRDIEPKLEYLVKIETQYRELVAGLKNAPVGPFRDIKDGIVGVSVDYINKLLPDEDTGVVDNGTKQLQAEAPEAQRPESELTQEQDAGTLQRQ